MPPPTFSRRRVLLVEDSVHVRDLLGRELAKLSGVELTGWADTASDAVERWTAIRPDITILDLTLREGNGFDVLRAIRSADPASCIIIHTAHDAEPIRRRATTEGAQYFISKNRGTAPLVTLLGALTAAIATDLVARVRDTPSDSASSCAPLPGTLPPRAR
jgi:two-component system, OmpR family, response regulator